MAQEFAVIQLPRTYDDIYTQSLLPTLITKSKTLRLESLQTNPEAFSSTYDREIQFPDSTWANRLKNPIGRTIIATDLRNTNTIITTTIDDSSSNNHSNATSTTTQPPAPSSVPFDTAIAAPWIGNSVLIGPRSIHIPMPMNGPALYALLHPPPSSSSSSNALSNTTDNDDCDDGGDGGGGLRPRLYVINAVYVRPAGRGKGVGRMLIEAMVRAAEEETAEAVGSEKLSDCAVVIYVEKENVSARRLYESCGFVQISEDEYTGETFRKGVSVALKRDMKTVKS